MRCPNCGSTAQFTLIRENKVGKYLDQTYKCGCGTTIELTFEEVMRKVITKGGTRL